MTKFLTLAIVIYLSALSSVSLAHGNIEKLFLGKWVGGSMRENTLNIDGNTYRISLRIEEYDGILITRMESPDADIFNITASETSIDGYKIKIFFKEIDSLFRGTLNAEKMELNGTFILGNKYISIGFKKIRTEN
ncbi:MAG: hypothetical protein NTX65_09940 [Ignavibacteriales bacterium]|nr:hypothetical protein [Ignavibacteriales bacterium]